jgi:cytochrome oxidase Cu insertion factor (SCO1/SenC/PrrC family)/quinol-cytochrome oxidoreductase complex cytochrome b subunit
MRRLALMWPALLLPALLADAGWSATVLDEAEALRIGEAAVGQQLEDHVLRDSSVQRVTLSDFRGKPLLINFVYTSCSSVCPTIVQTLDAAVGAAQQALGEDSFAVVTIGFDTRNDTPERMRAFARAQGIDRPGWRFLSGDSRTVEALAAQVGFVVYPAPQGFDHMALTTVVDQEGRIYRQIYGGVFEARRPWSSRSRIWCSAAAATGPASRGWSTACACSAPCTIRAPVRTGSTTRHSSRSPSGSWRSLASAGSPYVSGAEPALGGRAPDGCERAPMTGVREALRLVFERLERLLDRTFPPAWQPLYHLGALGFFFYWIVAVSGIYLYIFFDTGVAAAYGSVEYLTHRQWYVGGVMRSLHRYASDAMIVVMVLHLLREFSLDRYRGPRWFTWVTGVPILLLVVATGITGYWLVWDKLAQYVAVVTTEWLDRLPIFGQSIARNFLSPDTLDDRFFTLLVFMHIVLPLLLLLVLWIHLQRVSRPQINPARGLAVGMFLTMLALSLMKPALSQGPADLATVPALVGLDWFYLGFYPLIESWPGAESWGMLGALVLILLMLPRLPPLRRAPVAVVDLANCNGCTRCANDCPYNAITMTPRTDGRAFEREAVVNPSLCVSCGICAAISVRARSICCWRWASGTARTGRPTPTPHPKWR